MLNLDVCIISRGLMGWMIAVTVLLCICVSGNPNATFFRIGPHPDLILFGISIHTGWRYFVIFLYTCVSTIVRTLQQEVLRPWIIQQIQNEKPKSSYVLEHAYFIVAVETCFIWFDWFMYINILLAQIDLMIVEMVGNLAATFYTTRSYIASSSLQTI